MATRDLFMGPYKDGKINIDFIADKIVLPKFVVRFVMSDIWAEFYQTMMAELRAELPIPDRVAPISGVGIAHVRPFLQRQNTHSDRLRGALQFGGNQSD